jgi:eukaryotic-like serine/threonine-protein kinase
MDPRDTANRDLLIGLLALQNGMVEQDLLVAAFRSWTRDKTRPIVEILAAQGAIDVDDRALLEGLARKHLKRHGGDGERSLAALNAGPSTREALAGIGDTDIEATLGQVGSGSAPGEAGRTGTYHAGGIMSDGARFRVLRPHARGGLGEVFVALDEELHREVALKQILGHHADDPTSRTRFVLEAEITGGLEHPGIVPVYGLGSYGDGRPYYAMRFVRGDSLKEAIAAFHSDGSLKADPGKRSLALRKLLRRFVDVCNAIDYAHTRGVLHRDIKPGNVIVGKHGETLVVDWGLAKAMGRAEPGSSSGERTLLPSSASGSAETLPGSAMGTPAYMSPEQAAGDLDRLGPRSDVYSLGATLYCLLAGRPPFEGDDVGAVLRAAQKGDFPRPRTADPSIDRALEAVCLKAMALEPVDRYPTPKGLADDVERWAADEPVAAWREPWTRTLTRWLTRHRTGVTALAAAGLVAMGGLVAVAGVQARANGRLREANLALAVANGKVNRANSDLSASNEREQARFALAMEAIQTFHSGVSEDLLLKQKEFGALRAKLLGGARDFYRRLEGLLQGQSDRDSRRSLAKAYYEVGKLTSQIETARDALAVQGRALALFEGLAREAPDNPDLRHWLGRCWMALTQLHVMRDGGAADSLAALARAREVFEAAVAARPSDLEARADLAEALSYLASMGPPAEALEASRRACAAWEALLVLDPGSVPFRHGHAASLGAHAMYLQNAGRPAESLTAYARARDLDEALVREHPTDPRLGHELVRTLGNMAIELLATGRRGEAMAAFERAREVIAAMAAANPTLLSFQGDLAWIEGGLAAALTEAGRDDEALEALDRARAAREALLKVNPENTRHQRMLAYVLGRQAAIHRKAGRFEPARVHAGRAVEILERLAGANRDRLEVRSSLLDGYNDLADLELAAGRPDRARAVYEKALADRRRASEADPSDASARALLADATRRLGTALQAAGRPADAIDRYRRSLALLGAIERPTGVNIYDMACCRSLVAGASELPGAGLTAAEGRAEAARAVALVRRAFEAGYNALRWARDEDADLVPIRHLEAFRILMMDLAMPADPFAAVR